MNEIVILSGKGGTGKTSISSVFSTCDGKVVAADCDVDTSNLFLVLQPQNYREERFLTGHKADIQHDLCSNCGLCMSYCRFGAISQGKDSMIISDTLCDGCKLCARICPEKAIEMVPSDQSVWYEGSFRNGKMVHARLAPGEENSGKLVNVVREQARKTARENKLETIIIDGPPGIGCPVISSLTGTQKAVIVTEPTLSGFHDMKRVCRLIEDFRIRAYVIINKYDLNPAITRQIVDWCQEMKITLAGKIPFDVRMVDAMVNCQSINEYAPESELSRELNHCWKIIQAPL